MISRTLGRLFLEEGLFIEDGLSIELVLVNRSFVWDQS